MSAEISADKATIESSSTSIAVQVDAAKALTEGGALIETAQRGVNGDKEEEEKSLASKPPPKDDNDENQPPSSSSSQTSSKHESKKRNAGEIEEKSNKNVEVVNYNDTLNHSDKSNREESKKSADTQPEEEQKQPASPVPKTKPPPPRPIKKARTAYFIFADEKRPELQAAHPGEGVAVVARQLGHAWGNLNDEERAKYQLLAAEERARVTKELEKYKALYGDVPIEDRPGGGSLGGKNDGLVMPVARIRKICKLDPEVRGISKEATLLVTKCTEFCLEKLGQETVKVARLSNRRKLLPEDVAQVCSSREQYLFLREDIKDILQQQAQEAAQKKGSQQKDAAAAAVGSSNKPLTAYFGSPSK